MRAELGLPSVRGDDEKGGGMMGGFGGSMGGVGDRAKGKRPINVKFEVSLVPCLHLVSMFLIPYYRFPTSQLRASTSGTSRLLSQR